MRGFPLVEAVPHPDRVAFMADGKELLGYVFNPLGSRPFLFPVVGPAGRYVTRIGHPHDPAGHSHHLSVWLGHRSVNGVNFWEESADAGRQIHRRVAAVSDEGARSSITSQVDWVTAAGETLMVEARTVCLRLLADTREFLIDLKHVFEASSNISLAKTPFGLLGVRVAKTMTVNDGGGTVTTSEGMRDEKEAFWKRGRWCDYSGPVTPSEWNGLTLFDHPGNPDYPPCWHVRNDGWMCPSHFLEKGIDLKKGEHLNTKYRIYVHSGRVNRDRSRELFEEFSKE
ncbi:MAG: PmoA family protein [Candidatus Bathyarchaeia archaeon]